MEQIGDGIAILTSGVEKTRNNDVNYIFRQDSTFWYFTGFNEPDSIAVLAPNSDKPYTLFVPPYDENYETWVGRRAGTEGAVNNYMADQAFSIEDLDEYLPDLLSSTNTLYYTPSLDHDIGATITSIISSQRRNHSRGGTFIDSVKDISLIASQMRLIKSDTEIQQIRTAINKLKSTNEITIKTNKQGSVIEIVKYAEYQILTNKVTNKQPDSNQQLTTNKNVKKEKKLVYRSFKHLSITVEDVRKLDKEYTKKQIDSILDAIENYAKNKSYTSLYLTAKKWLAKEYPKQKEKIVIHPKDYLA